MLIATFAPTTGWAGKKITREGDAFIFEDYGEISAQDIMEYGRQGHLVWANEGTRAWVGSKAAAAPKPPSRTQIAATKKPASRPYADQSVPPPASEVQGIAGGPSAGAVPISTQSPWWQRPNVVIPVVVGVVAAVLLIVVGGLAINSQSKQKASAEKVMEPFRKLDSALTVGVNFSEYGKLVQNAQFAFDTYKPSGGKSNEAYSHLSSAISDYSSALDYWNSEIQDDLDMETERQEAWSSASDEMQQAADDFGL